MKKVDGGLYRVQQLSELRVRAAASVRFAHKKALETYHVGLFDAALREPPAGGRRPSSDEVQQASDQLVPPSWPYCFACVTCFGG